MVFPSPPGDARDLGPPCSQSMYSATEPQSSLEPRMLNKNWRLVPRGITPSFTAPLYILPSLLNHLNSWGGLSSLNNSRTKPNTADGWEADLEGRILVFICPNQLCPLLHWGRDGRLQGSSFSTRHVPLETGKGKASSSVASSAWYPDWMRCGREAHLSQMNGRKALLSNLLPPRPQGCLEGFPGCPECSALPYNSRST